MNISLYCYLFITVCAILYGKCQGDQPPYQVSLHMSLHPKLTPIHVCNGAIIQSSLVIVPAQCLYYRFLSNERPILAEPYMFQVVAGSTSAFSDALTLKITEINICDKFNINTLENDLAILHLSNPLPLASRDDMKWIILDDHAERNETCVANFHSKSFGYTQTEELEQLDNEECSEVSKNLAKRKIDICSHYILPSEFDCNQLDAFVEYNGDRGTGFICNNRLVAILSTILSAATLDDITTNCTETPMKALYTNLGPHLDWIYEIIAFKEYRDLMQHNYTSSPPYRQQAGSIMQSANQTSSSLSLIWQSSGNTTTANISSLAENNAHSINQAKNPMLFILFISLWKISAAYLSAAI